MTFFKRLRPISRASFKEKPTVEDDHSSHSGNSHESPSAESNNGALTPASSLPSSSSTTSIPRMAGVIANASDAKRPGARPLAGAASSSSNSQKRRSISNFSSSMTQAPKIAEGFYAPVVTNLESGTWVHTKVVLIRGYCGDPSKRPLDGRLKVKHDKDAFPATSWNVHDGQFKALVYLSPGPNTIRLEFFSQKLADNKGSLSLQRRDLRVNYLPMNNSPPLRLALLVAKDSKYTFDTTPERKQREGNDLNVAVKKYRMAAQLWQTFTADKMRHEKMGRRTFRFEEEYTMSTLSWKDQDDGIMRNEPQVNIVQLDNTTEEIQMMSEQQLLDAAVQALHDHLRPFPEQREHVAAMLLDTHWDAVARQLAGHAAISGGDKNIKVALYGSHALHTYPSCIEDVVPAFEDSNRTNAAYVSNLNGTSGSSWEAANTALWEHLRHVSEMFGCETQSSGIMCPQQPSRFSRCFVTNESFSTAEQRKGLKPVMETDEMAWCKLDLLRFRSHPCFRIPNDPAAQPDCNIQFWPLNDRRINISARNGIAFIEAYADNDATAVLIKDFISQPPIMNADGAIIRSAVPNVTQITEKDIRSALPPGKGKGHVRVVAHSAGTARAEIPDLAKLFDNRKVKMPGGKPAYRSPRIGYTQTPNAEEDLILHNAVDLHKLLQSVKIFTDSQKVYGLEFLFEGQVSQFFGNREAVESGNVDMTRFDLDTREAEILSGFTIRVAEYEIAGIRFSTNLGRRSQWYGQQTPGGQANDHSLIAPAGFTIAGVSGTVASCLTSFAVLVKM